MSPTRKDTPITNPNDPRFKLQNEIQILACIIDITTTEVTRQRWIQEGLIKALVVQLMKKKRELETAPVEDKPAKQDKKEQSSKNAADHFLDVISNLKISIQNTISYARDAAIKAVDAQIKDPATNAMAKNIVAKVFNNQLAQQSSDLLQNVASNEFNLAAELDKADPSMHESIRQDHEQLQSAVKTGDPQKALEKAVKLQTTVSYAVEMKEALKTEVILVSAAEPTPEQRMRVVDGDAHTIRIAGNTGLIGYADREGNFAEHEVKDRSELQRFKDILNIPAPPRKKSNIDDEMLQIVREIIPYKGETRARYEARTIEARKKLLTLFNTDIKPIANNAAEEISKSLLTATEKCSLLLGGSKPTISSFYFMSAKANGTPTDTRSVPSANSPTPSKTRGF
jgi:hypothetical protein